MLVFFAFVLGILVGCSLVLLWPYVSQLAKVPKKKVIGLKKPVLCMNAIAPYRVFVLKEEYDRVRKEKGNSANVFPVKECIIVPSSADVVNNSYYDPCVVSGDLLLTDWLSQNCTIVFEPNLMVPLASDGLASMEWQRRFFRPVRPSNVKDFIFGS